MNDPRKHLRRRSFAARVAAVVIIAIALIWSLGQVADHTDALPVIPYEHAMLNSESADQQGSVSFDASVFSVQLWNPPPALQAEPSTQMASVLPPAPPKVQLVGIITESGALQAALYDLTDDKLIIVAPGQSVQNFTVKSVGPEGVVITNGRNEHELRIRENQS